MKVKRYEAKTMQEAIGMVRSELGRDAIILHSKKIRRGGIFGLFGKPAVEVVAAISPEDRPVVRREAATREPAIRPATDYSSLQKEISGVKEAIASLNSTLVSTRPNVSEPSKLPPGKISTLLSKQGVADTHIREIVADLGTGPAEELINQAKSLIAQSMRFSKSEPHVTKPRVIALIGPTGVGKTTTIAKLAAQYGLYQGLDVGLITADTYRIAAVDQLKTYAEIIGVPLEVVFSVEEMAKARAKLADKDCILIDTAGRSQRNQEQLTELQEYLDAAEPNEVALVLSATTQPMGLRDCLEKFKPCQYSQLIFTKLDEAATFGMMYSAIRDAELPLTHLTFGQNVPDDIRPGDPEYVAGLLFEGEQGV